MLMPPKSGHNINFGTMMQIRSVRMFPDGRSVIETSGTYRFRIMERGTLDGYMVGRIERIDDYPEEIGDTEESLAVALQNLGSTPSAPSSSSNPPRTLSGTPPDVAPVDTPSTSRLSSAHSPVPSNEALMDICRKFLARLQRGAEPWVVQRLNNTYGAMPADPSNFSYWVALVLPIDDVEKAKLFPIKSPRLRLRLVVYWIEQLNSNWWFSGGCIIT